MISYKINKLYILRITLYCFYRALLVDFIAFTARFVIARHIICGTGHIISLNRYITTQYAKLDRNFAYLGLIIKIKNK